MLNATVELFLSEYFLFKAVLGKYLENSETLFRVLSRIFLIPQAQVAKLYRLTQNDVTQGIITENDFMQYQRMQKYSQLIGSESKVDAAWEEITNIKGNAILMAQAQELIVDADVSRNTLYTCLSSGETRGVVSAMRIMGILKCEGIFLDQNKEAGVKTLSKAADWNDSISMLALLYYCGEGRSFNMARLTQVLTGTPFEALGEIAAKQYGEAGEWDVEEVKLLDKSFHSGVLKRDIYDPKYARILHSCALYMKDKEKAVFTPSKEQLCAISDLPLKLSREKMTVIDDCELHKTAIKRESEVTAIVHALKNSDLRCKSSYRPLCLTCESKYVLNMYARAIRVKNASAHYEIIDVADLSEYDLEPTQNNIFVRSIDEDRDNRFLLFFYGEIPERKFEAVKSILRSARRAKFHLFSPNVTLNLSAVLPICFCDEANSQLLKPYCDEIVLAKVAEEELPAAIQGILSRTQKLYGVGTISLSGDVQSVFSGYDVDTAERLIDAAVRARREKGAAITLSREILQQYVGDSGRQTIGFGGNRNEK